MARLRFLAAALLLLQGSLAFGSPAMLDIAMRLFVDGEPMASPRVVVPSGATAEISLEQRLRIELTASQEGALSDIRLQVHAAEGGSLHLVGSPRLLAPLGEVSSIEWTADSGARYRLVVTPVVRAAQRAQ